MKRWRQADGTIHADGASGNDATLCGFAFDGDGDDTCEDLVQVDRGKINCHDCIAIIDAAKAIPERRIRR